jgi:predicted lipoprotein with Yx(FWY)xxD motif
VKRSSDPIRCARWTIATLAVLAFAGLAGCAGPSNPTPSTGNKDADAVLAAQASAQAQAPETAGGDAAQGRAQSGGTAQADPGGRVELWAVQSGALGVLVADGDGRPIYLFDRDSRQPPSTACTGSCIDTWPPVLIGNQPPDLEGVNAALVGSFVRPDGRRQLTLAGWPLYRHAGDDGNLSSTYGNGDDNAWFVIAPSGTRALSH